MSLSIRKRGRPSSNNKQLLDLDETLNNKHKNGNFLSTLIPYLNDYLIKNINKNNLPSLSINVLRKKNNEFQLNDLDYIFEGIWVVLQSKKTKENKFFKEKEFKSCVLSLINWHLEYYLKSGSHQMEFFIVGDDFKFSYQKNKKNLSYSYVKNQFRINLLSSSSLVKTNKEFANLIFKFKKKLLKEKCYAIDKNQIHLDIGNYLLTEEPKTYKIEENSIISLKRNWKEFNFGKENIEEDLENIKKENLMKKIKDEMIVFGPNEKTTTRKTFLERTNQNIVFDKETITEWKKKNIF